MTTTTEVKFRSSCDLCLITKVKCSQTKPSCERCIRQGLACVYSQYRRVGRPPSFQRKRAALAVAEAETRHQHHHDARSTFIQVPDTAQRPLPPPANLVRTTTQHSTEDRRTSFLDDGGKATDCNVGVAPAPDFVDAFHVGKDQAGDELNWYQFDLGDIIIDSSRSAPENPTTSHQNKSRQSPASATSLQRSSISLSHDLFWPSDRHIHQSPVYFDTPEQHGLFSSSADRFSASSSGCLPPSTTEPSIFSSAPAIVPLLLEPSPASSSGSSDAPNLFRAQEPRCMLRCQTNLTRQLGEFRECQDSDSVLAFDMLLAQEARTRELLHKTLGCGFCMERSRCGQTIIIVVMIVTNLHDLFERGCGAAGGATTTQLTNHAPSMASYKDNGTRVPGDTLEGRQGSVWGSDAKHGPLVVGKIRLDDSVQGAFSQILLQMYLNQQHFHVQQLEMALKGVEATDVNCKVAYDLLENVTERLDTFRGFLSLIDPSGTLNVHRIIS